jgi:hypothetical protein
LTNLGGIPRTYADTHPPDSTSDIDAEASKNTGNDSPTNSDVKRPSTKHQRTTDSESSSEAAPGTTSSALLEDVEDFAILTAPWVTKDDPTWDIKALIKEAADEIKMERRGSDVSVGSASMYSLTGYSLDTY